MGLKPGDRAAVMTYNLPEYFEVRFALRYLQAGVVMVGYRMKPPEIEFMVDNSDSKSLFFWHEFADRILPFKERYKKVLPGGFVGFGGPVEGALPYEDLFLDLPEIDLDSLPPIGEVGSDLIYTSGVTGKPKGTVRPADIITRPEVRDYMLKTVSLVGMTSDEVHLVCCPLYHSAPMAFVAKTVMLGGTIVLEPRFDPVQVLQLVEKYKVTSTLLVPTMVVRLLQVSQRVSRDLDLSSLRSVACGGAPLLPQYKLAFLDRYGDRLYEFYGSTETGVNTFISPREIRERPASVGKAFASNELKIYDPTGNEVADGERGVLYIYNPFLMEGYYKNQEATSEVFRGKFMTVGDVAIRDADGYYYIVDRVKDMIIRGGVNIYPAEVEGVLASMPGISDAAVVGKPDPELGEIVAAFIVPKEGVRVTQEEIQEYCEQRMENHKIPVIIVFTHEIPRTPTGKILKAELREAVKDISA
jgi:acyl-CoA synthetase (AMP-forming)/AMP-acid ligase II